MRFFRRRKGGRVSLRIIPVYHAFQADDGCGCLSDRGRLGLPGLALSFWSLTRLQEAARRRISAFLAKSLPGRPVPIEVGVMAQCIGMVESQLFSGSLDVDI